MLKNKASSNEDTASEINQGVEAFKQKNYTQALSHFRNAEKNISIQLADKSDAAAKLTYNIGRTLLNLQQYKEAAFYLQRSCAIRSRVYSQDDEKRNVATPFLREALENNKVTIYVWAKDRHPTGHVSLKTYRGGPQGNGIYASFWPWSSRYNWINQMRQKGGSCCLTESRFRDHLHESLSVDEGIYRLQANQIFSVDLYTLDITAINIEFLKMKILIDRGEVTWRLLGGSASIFGDVLPANCSTLVARLLIAGGINTLFTRPLELPDLLNYWINAGVINLNRISAVRQAGSIDPRFQLFDKGNDEEAFCMHLSDFFKRMLGSIYVASCMRPKPLDIATFVLKAKKAEEENIFFTMQPTIIERNGHFLVAEDYQSISYPPEVSRASEHYSRLLQEFPGLLQGTAGVFFNMQYFNISDGTHRMSSAQLLEAIERQSNEETGSYRVIHPDFIFKSRIKEWIAERGLSLGIELNTSNAGWVRTTDKTEEAFEYFIELPDVKNILDLRRTIEYYNTLPAHMFQRQLERGTAECRFVWLAPVPRINAQLSPS